jgi:hypothetical protein
MAKRSTCLVAALSALIVFVPQASAQLPLPEPRTHVDPVDVGVAAADPNAPKVTLLDPVTKTSDVRHGYLYVRARCDVRCLLQVTATTTIAGKRRQVATVTQTLRSNKITRLRLKIGADVRRKVDAGARFRYEASTQAAPTA